MASKARRRRLAPLAALFGPVAALALGLAAATTAGCAGEQSLVLVGGRKVDAETIDRDPMALLPSGVILLGYLDAPALFASNLGPDTGRLVSNLLPIGPESGFVPARDLTKLYGGVYAMQGADFCVVAQGNFDVEAIRRAAEARATTPAGVPVVKTRYADTDMFTAGNVGFVVLTAHTVVSGNETGMRRALDRLRFGKLERSMPGWMVELTETKGAAFALAGDFSTQTAAAAAAKQLPFLTGLRAARVLGNFQQPGLNFVGSLSYDGPQSAANGAAMLKNLQGVTRFMGLFSSWGLGAAVPAMQVADKESDVAFTLPLEATLVGVLLRLAADATRPAAFASAP